MAFPGYPLPSNKTNITGQQNDHPDTHNQIAVALNDVQDQIDNVPSTLVLPPVGSILPFAGASAPAGDDWLLATGQAVSRTEYSTLFSTIGTTYGSGNGTTTFNLPDLRGAFPIGRDAAQSEFTPLGNGGGSKTHTLTTAQMPSHTHPMGHSHTINHNHPARTTTSSGAHNHAIQRTGTADTNHGHAGGGNVSTAPSAGATGVPTNGVTLSAGAHTHSVDLPNFTGNSGSFSGNTGSRGSGNAFPTLPPYLVINFLIRAR